MEVLSARNELKLAVRRAEDLQVSKITLFTTTIIFNADVKAAIHGEMDSETDMDDTVGDSEDEDLLLQQASRIQSKSRFDINNDNHGKELGFNLKPAPLKSNPAMLFENLKCNK